MPLYEADPDTKKFKQFGRIARWIQTPYEHRTDFADLAKGFSIPAVHIHSNYGKGWTSAERTHEINEHSMQHGHLPVQPPTPTLGANPTDSTPENKPPTHKKQMKNPLSASKGKGKARERSQSQAGSPSPLPAESSNEEEVTVRKRAVYGTMSKVVAKSYSIRPGESMLQAYTWMLAQHPEYVCKFLFYFCLHNAKLHILCSASILRRSAAPHVSARTSACASSPRLPPTRRILAPKKLSELALHAEIPKDTALIAVSPYTCLMCTIMLTIVCTILW